VELKDGFQERRQDMRNRKNAHLKSYGSQFYNLYRNLGKLRLILKNKRKNRLIHISIKTAQNLKRQKRTKKIVLFWNVSQRPRYIYHNTSLTVVFSLITPSFL